MICSGASEATMAQWASAFTESALGVSKTVGDLAGPGPVCHVHGHLPHAVRQIQREAGFDQGHAALRRHCVPAATCWLPCPPSPHSRACRLCALRPGCGHHVAGFYQHLLAEMPKRRYGDVCVPGPGRRFGRYCKSRYGRQSFRNGWRESEKQVCWLQRHFPRCLYSDC